MQKDERDLLDVLKFELNFLEKGGYGSSPREPWRPKFLFEDSPTCMNYDCKENPAPCSDCVMMRLVPPEFRAGKNPCRQIELNASGETLDNLYRYGDQHEIEETFGNWLRATIDQLEEQRKLRKTDENDNRPDGVEGVQGTGLHQSVDPKCANPACCTGFHWGGGKFFRFQRGGSVNKEHAGKIGLTGNVHDVRHFWLCERCSHTFTLVHTAEGGVMLKLLWSELRHIQALKKAACS